MLAYAFEEHRDNLKISFSSRVCPEVIIAMYILQQEKVIEYMNLSLSQHENAITV